MRRKPIITKALITTVLRSYFARVSRRGLLDHKKTERVSRSEKMCARIALSLTLPESSRDESPDWAPPNNSQPPN